MRAIHLAGPALALALFAGCADGTAPTAPRSAPDAAALSRGPGAQGIRFVHRAPRTPPFKNEVFTLVARAGSESSVTMTFADGSPFARLSLSAESMRNATVNGEPVPEDQELVITLRRVDASRYLVDLQPSGLVFNPAAPAELVFYYANAAVGPGDEISVWKQERRGDSWEATDHQDDRGRRQMQARVKDFTVYAMGYGRSARAE